MLDMAECLREQEVPSPGQLFLCAGLCIPVGSPYTSCCLLHPASAFGYSTKTTSIGSGSDMNQKITLLWVSKVTDVRVSLVL